jgi:hypothetical protein
MIGSFYILSSSSVADHPAVDAAQSEPLRPSINK